MLTFHGITTHQNRKCMDILLRFLDEDENQVVTKYSTSIYFPRTKAVVVTEMLLKLEEEECLSVPFVCLSADGTNISKAIFRNLDENLKEKGFKELLGFFNCPLDIMLNVFRKLIINLGEAVA